MMKQLTNKEIFRKRVNSYFMIFLGTFIYIIGLQGFLQTAQTFSTGLAAFAALPTFIWPFLNQYITFVYFGLNIPIILIFWNKVSKRFLSRTIFNLIVQISLGALFLIPGVHNSFTNLLDFKGDIEEAQWPIFILALMGSILMGFGISMTWRYGGSTGGTDIITYYYSTKKRISISSVMFVISMSITLLSFATTISINQEIRDRWLITLFSSGLYVVITVLIVSLVYPKYRTVEVRISSTHVGDISKKLKKTNYWHSWTISSCYSGYSGAQRQILTTNVYLLEVKELVSYIKSLDDSSYISISPIKKLFGSMNSSKIDDL